MGSADHLVNTVGCVNKQKSDSDVAEWLPHSRGEGYSVLDGCSKDENFDVSLDANGDGSLTYSEYFEPYPNAWCNYVSSWVEVKAEWGLSMDETEYDAAKNILSSC